MNKKRILSIITAILLVMSMATLAFATEGEATAANSEAAAANSEAATPWYGGLLSFAPMIIIILVFYFVLIRPESKRKKETAKMRESLSKGDEITTIGGIIGTITKVKDDEITIETGAGADKCKIRFAKWAISSVNTKSEDTNKKAKNDIEEDIEEDTKE